MAGTDDNVNDDAILPPSSSSLPPGVATGLCFGRYEVLRTAAGLLLELGRGGMGVTYKARDPELGRVVVLKVINALLLGHDPQNRARFRREARSAARIHHPHVATVFDIGEARGEDYYVMEFVEGENLLHRLQRDGSLNARATLRVARQVAQALAAAWEQRVVHRDIKPANLMVVRRPAEREAQEGMLIKVVDFGLAKALVTPRSSSAAAVDDHDEVTLTTTTRPAHLSYEYASPEQIEGRELDIRSDLYSLGVTLWHCLTGKSTFGALPPARATVAHLEKPPPFDELRAVAAPGAFVDFLDCLLQKEPEDRFATPEAALEALVLVEREVQSESSLPPLLGRSVARLPGRGSSSLSPSSPVLLPRRESSAVVPQRRSAESIAPAGGGDALTAAELLRQRGKLSLEETLILLEALAPAVDAVRRADDPSVPDLDPAQVAFRPIVAPQLPATDAETAPATVSLAGPVSDWPEFVVELRSTLGLTSTAPLLADVTQPPLRPAGDAVVRLAALVYELLAGQAPPAPPDAAYRPLALNEPVNAVLPRALAGRGSERFATAADFADALRTVARADGGRRRALPLASAAAVSEADNSMAALSSSQPSAPSARTPPRPQKVATDSDGPAIGAFESLRLRQLRHARNRRRRRWLALALAALLVGGGFAAWENRHSSAFPQWWRDLLAGSLLPRWRSASPAPSLPSSSPPRSAPSAAPSSTAAEPSATLAAKDLADARAAMTRADYEAAWKFYQDALKKDPASPEARLGLDGLRRLAADCAAKGLAAEATDPFTAAQNYRVAASLGNAAGCAGLGMMHAEGRGGLPKDESKAVELFRKAAEGGSVRGQVSLGVMYERGRGGLPKDEVKAAEIYRQAANNGDASGQVNLGVMYAQGRGGLMKDEIRAVDLYRKAAAQGNALGQAYLGELYELGRGGLPKNEAKAVELYRQAAAQGDEFAKSALQRLGKGR
ncbi:MAG: SEL1-like repeat protein [Verrucomicrobia bacterium]|nr:SEL1-like repeat protein [Verrucomicrobiota bacterium]